MKVIHSLTAAFGLLLGFAVAHAQTAQPDVSSSDASVTYGDSFSPDTSGGAGSGNWQFCIAGQTNWNPQPNGPAGTDDPSAGWETSWTPSAAGTYQFYVAKCGDNTYANSNFAGPYNLTVNKASMQDPTATDEPSGGYTVTVGQSWGGPSIYAPSSNGTGDLLWCASGGNAWTSGSWTPTQAGTYTVYVGQKADSNHTGNATDPVQGNVQVGSSSYTLNVVKQTQSAVTVSPSSTNVDVYDSGATVSLSASGGDGSGDYVWGGAASGTGSSTSVTLTDGGDYTVTVYRSGDNTYANSDSATATITATRWYTISVSYGNGAGDYTAGTQFGISPATPSNQEFQSWSGGGNGTIESTTSPDTNYTVGTQSATITCNYRAVTGTFGSQYGLTPYAGALGQAPVGGTYNVNVGFNTSALTYVDLYKNGVHLAGAWQGTQADTSDTATGTENFHATYSESGYNSNGYADTSVVIVSGTAPTITQQPTNATVTAGQTATFTVTAGGSPAPGYQWHSVINGADTAISGATAATLSIANATAANAGSYYVVVANTAGTVTSSAATLTVNAATYTLSVTNGTASQTTGLTDGQAVNISAAAAPSGQIFASWTQSGTKGSFGDIHAANTTFTMGAESATVTANYAQAAPVITSATSANATTGVSFTYAIVASNGPTSYSAANLPPGLTLDPSSGIIHGTPTTLGSYNVSVTATNSGGTGSATVTITVRSGTPNDTGNSTQLNVHLPRTS